MDFKTNIAYRKEMLIKLLNNVLSHENEIIDALYQDFKKPAFEAVLTETSYVVSELKDTIKNIKKWSKPKAVLPSILNFPSRDFIYKEPYGKVLIIAPWNYPYQLAMCPLISAIAAGNQVVLKPSELTPKTSEVLAKIIALTFRPEHVAVVQGGVEVSKGGKTPCIVDETANLKLSAKRIVWGKFINAGQTCIAPDYILVQKDMKEQFIKHLKEEITLAYGLTPKSSPDYSRIINLKNWSRLTELIEADKVIFGGQTDQSDCYIAPTLIAESNLDSLVMKDEIFGPLLPILTYASDADLHTIISRYEKPLSMYVFTENKTFATKMITNYSFGGGCINDTVVHFSNKRLPFGGVGHSGIGAYHGSLSFDVFSHSKGIVKKANWLDLSMRYAPYSDKLKTIRKLLKWL